jgi:hypothetical protein
MAGKTEFKKWREMCLQYREELRTAKITALVLVIASVCWSPFFLLVNILRILS